MDVEIQTQQVEMQPAWRAALDERLARLAERYPRLMRVHVTLRHGRHLHGTEEVDIVALCPGAVLCAAKQEETMRDALHAALDALARELGTYHEGRRRSRRLPVDVPMAT